MRTVIFAAAALFIAQQAQAHMGERPDLDPWFKTLKSEAGNWCCDGTDAMSVDDPEWKEDAAGYHVALAGSMVPVPPDAVVQGVNKAGVAIVWPITVDGKQVVRCFMPGPRT